MKCALCGLEFPEKEVEQACHGCPLAGACRLSRCPNCGYEMPAPPKLLGRWLRRWRRRRRVSQATAQLHLSQAVPTPTEDGESGVIILPLPQLRPGQRGRIARLRMRGRGKLQKLLALGLLPGVELQVIQKFPTYLLQVGLSQVAVDEEIAQEILVQICD